MVVNGFGFSGDASGPVRAAALVGVVLAGGEGRRMGAGVPKPLRRLGGKTMVAHVVERLRPQVMDLVVVTNDQAPGYRALPFNQAQNWARINSLGNFFKDFP